MKYHFHQALIGAFVTFAFTQSTRAADASWSLGTGGGNWIQDSAWTPASAPGATIGTTNADTATFDSTSRTVTSTIAVDAGRNIGNITFNTTNSFGYSLGSGPLILSANGLMQTTGSGSGQNTINAGLILQGSYTLAANANLQLNTANATITTAVSSGNVVMDVGGTWAGGTVLSSGIISEASGSTLSLVKTGSSTWQFNGNNTYSGGITIKEGSAGYGLNGGFGLGTVTLGDTSGTKNAVASFGSNTTMANPVHVQAGSNGTLALMRGGGSGASTITGAITLANNLTISQNASNSQNFNISSAISGTGNLSVKPLIGTGTTILSNASINFNGLLSNDGVSASPTLISGAIGANVIGVTQNSTTSILTLSGANTYTTPTTVNAGTLKIGNGTSIPTASAIIVEAMGTLDVNGINSTVGTFSGGGTITNNSTGTGTATLAATGGTWTGSIIDGTTAKLALTMNRATAITLGGTNTFTGGLTVGNTTNTPFTVVSENALGNGLTTVANNSSFRLTNGQTITGKTLSIQGTGGGPSGGNGNGALSLVSGAATWAGDIRSGSATTGGRIGVSNAGGTLTISGNISNNTGTSAAGLDLTINSDATLGNGIVVLSGTGNTYAGTTSVGRGILRIGANDVLPITTLLQVGTAGTVGARFDLNGYHQTVGGLQRTAVNALDASILNNGTTDSTLTISTALTTTASFNGSIKDGSKKVSVIKSGTGSQALVGVNSYTGNTSVSEGTLILGSGTANTALADTSDVIIGASGVLNLNFLASNSDTVNKLTIGGIQKVAGTWGATGSGAANIDDIHFAGPGTLTVTASPSAGYLAWIDTPSFALTTGQKGESSDPDGDGLTNLLEFVLNGNPSISDPSIMPAVNVTSTDFEFTFNRRDDSVSPETLQTFQYGSDLTNWSSIVVPTASGSVGAVAFAITDGTPTDMIKVSVPKTAVSPETKLFGRLRIIK